MFLILHSLEQRDLHGYAILRSITKQTDGERRLRTGTLYNALRRLENHGLISESAQPATEGEDPRRRTYCSTPLGKKVLSAEKHRMSRLLRLAHASDEALSVLRSNNA